MDCGYRAEKKSQEVSWELAFSLQRLRVCSKKEKNVRGAKIAGRLPAKLPPKVVNAHNELERMCCSHPRV